MSAADTQSRQLAEQELLQAFAKFLRGYQLEKNVNRKDDAFVEAWNDGISTAVSQMFDKQDNEEIENALAAFASHTRREALREAASLTCGCCAIDGDPEDWINKSTATPAGDDGGPRFVHVYPDGTTIECGTQEIWAAICLLAEEKK